jgi:hypothetical protein
MSKPLLWSFASSCIWIGVAISIAYAVSSIHTTPLDAALNFAGGIVASPAIGALIGYVARRFNKLTSGRRLLVALGDLYLATYLFLLSRHGITLDRNQDQRDNIDLERRARGLCDHVIAARGSSRALEVGIHIEAGTGALWPLSSLETCTAILSNRQDR